MEAVEVAVIDDQVAWQKVETNLNRDGWARLPFNLDSDVVDDLAALIRPSRQVTQWVDLVNAPKVAVEVVTQAYARLASIASRWAEESGGDPRFPTHLDGRTSKGLAAVGSRLAAEESLPLVTAAGGEGAGFPIQLVIGIGEPGVDYQGGEFVLTEQRPRMQSRPTVVPLRKGDVVAIPVGARPFEGSKGHYRVVTRHAVSRVLSGERLGLELFFRAA